MVGCDVFAACDSLYTLGLESCVSFMPKVFGASHARVCEIGCPRAGICSGIGTRIGFGIGTCADQHGCARVATSTRNSYEMDGLEGWRYIPRRNRPFHRALAAAYLDVAMVILFLVATL